MSMDIETGKGVDGKMFATHAEQHRDTVQEEIGAYWAASSLVYGWSAGAQAMALLRTALSSGVLDQLSTPRTPPQIADATGLPSDLVAQLLVALDAHRIVESAGDRYVLSAEFARLLSRAAVQPLANILDMEAAKIRSIESAAGAQLSYTALSSHEQLAIAKGIMGVPSSSLWQAMLTMMTSALPQLAAKVQAGGRALELGCGAASALITILVVYPRTTAVGVDISATALAEARRRADEVGVADRIEFRHQDARTVSDAAQYDLVSWSGHFFPADTRAATLAVAHKALKPDGYLLATSGGPSLPPECLHEPEGRATAMNRLLFASWGIPPHEDRDAETELEAAGFTITGRLPSTGQMGGLILAQRTGNDPGEPSSADSAGRGSVTVQAPREGVSHQE